jgi:hypothetical protein
VFDIEQSQTFLKTNYVLEKGRFFLCRTVALPNLAVGMTVPVVSPFGHPIIVNFYNAPLLPISLGVAKLKDYCTVFPVGTIIAIKEPWLKMALTGDTCNMRVDSPTDLIILRPAYPVLKKVIWQESFWRLNLWEPPAVVKRTAEAWKKRGNEVRSSNNAQAVFFAEQRDPMI